jgi:hypothetical protein
MLNFDRAQHTTYSNVLLFASLGNEQNILLLKVKWFLNEHRSKMENNHLNLLV